MNYFLLLKLLLIIFFLYNIIIHEDTIIIDNDNQMSEYENNINYSSFISDMKPIAFYLPFYANNETNQSIDGQYNDWTNIRKCKSLFKGHHQPRIPGDNSNYLDYYNSLNISVIKKQVELAKIHGIYGFAIYYYWNYGKKILEKPLDLYLNNKDINFPFLLIWVNNILNDKFDEGKKEIFFKDSYFDEYSKLFINDIQKYLRDHRYIKINNKPALGIYEPFEITNLNEMIKNFREKSKEYGIGEIFILVCLNTNETNKILNLNLFDGAYDFPPHNSLGNFKIKNKNTSIYYELIYKNNEYNFTNSRNFSFFRCSMVQFDNCPSLKKCDIFDYYSSEQFYFVNKLIIDWTKKHYNKENRYFFINSWNNWYEGTYLEPDKKYGYASINSLSKAIFNLAYIEQYSLNNLNYDSKIAVHIHLFYEDLINDIIKITNEIPVKFDLYISVCSKNVIEKIEKYIFKNSKANFFEIKIVSNKGRDVLPFLIQMKKVIKKYKYICHLHSKKSFHINFGDDWRNYLYFNLLGSNQIISEILIEFEKYDKLGLIFPEPFYKVLTDFGKAIIDCNIKYMNFIIKNIFPKYRISENYFDFPEGNMFWAKVEAIYQIFEINIEKRFSKENGKLDSTIIHGIERIWTYLAKLNGFVYKKIFKHI